MCLRYNAVLVVILVISYFMEIPAVNSNYNSNDMPSTPTLTQSTSSSSTSNSANDSTNNYKQIPRALLSQSDEYVAENQRKCAETRQLVSCIKYKASRLIWKLATNSLNYFPNEYSRELREDKRRIRFIQLAEPATEVVLFKDARSFPGKIKLHDVYCLQH